MNNVNRIFEVLTNITCWKNNCVKVLKNDVILFGLLTIPFENGENEFRFPYYSEDDSSITLLDEDGLILKGLTLNEWK